MKKADKEWNQYVEKAKNRIIFAEVPLLLSKAFRDLKFGPAIKVLFWFREKPEYDWVKGKHKKKRWVCVNPEIVFTYDEAKRRGLSDNQYSRALKELYKFGFIDIRYHGSGMHGDNSVYVFSERWRKYGTPQFDYKEFPKSGYFGRRKEARWKKYEIVIDESGKAKIRKREAYR